MSGIIMTVISGITSFWKKPTPVLHPVPPVASLMDLSITALAKRYEIIGQPDQPAPSLREWESVTWFIKETSSAAQKIKEIENAVLKDKPEGVTPESFLQANVTRMFKALKEAYPVPLTDLAKVSAWEDDALLKIYDFLAQTHPAQFPRLYNLNKIKMFFDDPSNRPAIEWVTEIELSERGIKAIPRQLSKFSNLQSLKLMNGEISFIPEWIGNLKNLRFLDLSFNCIQKIPDSLGNLTNLLKLDLRNNQINAIPDSLGRLTKLGSLDLGNNQIRTIPTTLSQLTKLYDFAINNNQIEEFPEWISSLPNFSPTSTTRGWLGFSHNKIRVIPATIPMSPLVQITLEYNNILTRLDGWGTKHCIFFYGNPIIKYERLLNGMTVPLVIYPDKEESQD